MVVLRPWLAAICHDDDVLAAFDDGVLWATIGQDTSDRHARVQRELNKLYAALTADGYESHKAPWDAFWGQRYAIILDPDGNAIDLFAALPSA